MSRFGRRCCSRRSSASRAGAATKNSTSMKPSSPPQRTTSKGTGNSSIASTSCSPVSQKVLQCCAKRWLWRRVRSCPQRRFSTKSRRSWRKPWRRQGRMAQGRAAARRSRWRSSRTEAKPSSRCSPLSKPAWTRSLRTRAWTFRRSRTSRSRRTIRKQAGATHRHPSLQARADCGGCSTHPFLLRPLHQAWVRWLTPALTTKGAPRADQRRAPQ
mmetsp:Transcript_15060/g.49392  ORF Transcript_15060/g.49392 Transcript_15060/m.49392 type:complete len:214 (+) Transcript_15060:1143-1784(+)